MIKLLKLLNYFRIRLISWLLSAWKVINWRIKNSHNFTQISYKVKDSTLITVGKYSYGTINLESFENKLENLTIGDFVSIASNVNFILGGNHQINAFTTYPLKSAFYEQFSEDDARTNGPIIVQDEVWIGNNAIIMSGVTIGKGSIVAAGSVVTKNVAPFSIVGGNPAKFIKWRIPEELIEKRMKIDLDYNVIKNLNCDKLKLFYSPLTQDLLDQIKKL